jgi:hypothetical protein
MFKTAYALVILAGLSAPAWSQTRGESVGTGSARYFGHLFFKDDTRIGLEPRPCLVRKKTGRTECRSMDEWRRIAKKIDEARESGQERQETP